MVRRRLGFVPVPALILTIAVLYFTVKRSLFYEPSWLLPITNTLFVTAVCFVVAYIAMRNYKANGRIQILLLGSGVLVFGIGGAIAGFGIDLPGGANFNVTVYNVGALVGALFHFAAALVLLAGLSPEAGAKRKDVWLVAGYAGATAFMALLTAASLKGMVPPFFIQGAGPTVLRQEILGTADVLFIFSFLIFMGTYFKNREVFLYWYSLALALTAISLTAFFIEKAVGSPVGWAGRLSQYIGGVYFLVSLITASRSARSRGASLNDVMTASLTSVEERFRSAFTNAAIGFSMKTPGGQYLDANPAYCALTGYSLAELRALEFPQLIHPGDRAANMQMIGRMLAGEIPDFTVENRYVRKGGQPVWVRKSVSMVRDARGAPHWIIALIEDITNRKMAEEALKESEERFRVAQELSPDGFSILRPVRDANGRVEDFTWVYGNPALERIVGMPLSALAGRRLLELFPGHRGSKFLSAYQRVAETGQACVEEALYHGDGGLADRWFRIAVVSMGADIIVHSQDITERKQAEEALKDAHAQLETRVQEKTAQVVEQSRILESFFTHTQTCLVFLDKDFNFIRVNEAFARVCARDVSDFIGHNYFADYPSEDLEGKFQRVADTKESYAVFERPFVFPDHPEWGVTYWDLAAAPILDVNNEVNLLVFSLHDVTKRTRAEGELKKYREHLEELVKERTSELEGVNLALKTTLAEKETLLKELYHRTKNNMNLVSNLISLQMNETKDPDVRQIFKEAQNRIHSMALVHEMLYKTRELSRLDLKDYLEQLARFVVGSYKTTNVKLNLDLDPAQVSLYVATPCGLIVNELLSNSLKHAFLEGRGGEISLSLRVKGDEIELACFDNGIGFQESFQIGQSASLGLKLVDVLARKQLQGSLNVLDGKKAGTGGEGAGIVVRFDVSRFEAGDKP